MSARPTPSWTDAERPRLRPVQIAPTEENDQGVSYVITDAQQLAPGALTVSPPVLFILSLLDGVRSLSEIREEFHQRVGQPLHPETLENVLGHLHQALLLHGDSFEDYYAGLAGEYGRSPSRNVRHPELYGNPSELRAYFDAMIEAHAADAPPFVPRGLVAPHLDYPRGAPCYGMAYGLLRHRPAPGRVIVLGTNHFGRSTSVCATGKDFDTPLGMARCDRDFLERLESRTGHLRSFEMDHAREHSVELQVLWLQHLFGSEAFKMVAVLCPDPSGPTGTAPRDGVGIDLDIFNRELGDLIEEDDVDTLVVAGADLSHVGTFFGEPRALDEAFLKEVAEHDDRVLETVRSLAPQALRQRVADDGNSTHICSVGCIYSLLQSLRPVRAVQLGYHQAASLDIDNCVTCAAFAFGGD